MTEREVDASRGIEEPLPSPRLGGSLTPDALPHLLRDLYLSRRTGRLRFERGEERAAVCFSGGSIVYGSANIPECMMGETFVRHGVIGQEQLRQALEASASSETRLGDALLELGFLDEQRLHQALALHVREILLCVFGWGSSAYAFEELDPERLGEQSRPLSLSTAEVILDAVWSIADAGQVRRALGDLDRVLLPSTDPLLRFQRVSLTPADGFLLSRIDGTLTARQVLASSATALEEAERSLLGLLSVGMIEMAPSPEAAGAPPEPSDAEAGTPRSELLDAYAAMGSRDHHQILGVPRDAAPAEVKAAYFRLARRWHPDALHDPALAGLGDEVHAVFARINAAYAALSSRPAGAPGPAASAVRPQKPSPGERGSPAPPSALAGQSAGDTPAAAQAPPPEAAPDPVELAEELERAKRLLAEGQAVEALGAAHRVLDAAEGRLRRRAWLVKARAYASAPVWKEEAHRELRALVREDPRNPDAFFLLGRLYERDGSAERARLMYRRVLSLDPTHDGARASLSAPSAGESKPRGVLARLFGRS